MNLILHLLCVVSQFLSTPMLYGQSNIEMDTTREHVTNTLKIHMTRVSDTRVGHLMDTIRLHDRSVCYIIQHLGQLIGCSGVNSQVVKKPSKRLLYSDCQHTRVTGFSDVD